MSLQNSHQIDILKSQEKDEQYQNDFISKFLDVTDIILRDFFNYRNYSLYIPILRNLSGLLYQLLSLSFNENQTIGEEFTSIKNFNFSDLYSKGTRISGFRRPLFLVLKFIAPIIGIYFVKRKVNLYRDLAISSEDEHPLKRAICKNFPDYEGLINLILKLNMAIFMIKGDFSEISKRIAGIFYIYTTQKNSPAKNYSRIGYLLLLQLILQFYSATRKIKRDYKLLLRRRIERLRSLSLDHDEISGNSSNTCNICFSTRKDATSTPCGHLYCWECIFSSLKSSPFCPSCRAMVNPKKLVQLINFQ